MRRDLTQVLPISKDKLNWFLSKLHFLRRRCCQGDRRHQRRAQLPELVFFGNEVSSPKFQVGSRHCIIVILSHADPFRTQGPTPRYLRRLVFLPTVALSALDSMLIPSIALLAFTLSSYQVWSEAVPIISFLVRILVTLRCPSAGARLIMVGVCWVLKKISVGCIQLLTRNKWVEPPLEGERLLFVKTSHRSH